MQALASMRPCSAETDPPACNRLVSATACRAQHCRLPFPFAALPNVVLQHADELAALMGTDASALHAEANAAANAANGCKGLPVGVATRTCELGDLQQWALANGRLEPGLLGG
jgi:hypothetical protein